MPLINILSGNSIITLLLKEEAKRLSLYTGIIKIALIEFFLLLKSSIL
jgi:hypothetical protein